MIRDRGYELSDAMNMQRVPVDHEAEIESYESFMETFQNNGGIIQNLYSERTRLGDPRKFLYVVFVDSTTASVGSANVMPILEVIGAYQSDAEYKLSAVIVIPLKSLTSDASSKFAADLPFYIQIYPPQDLYPPHHVLQPKITLLTEEEKAKVLADMKAVPSNFPKMFEGDAVIAYYGWPAGSMVRINRFNVGLSTFVDHSISYATIIPGNPVFSKALTGLL